jgi:signal transduction histidine kinase
MMNSSQGQLPVERYQQIARQVSALRLIVPVFLFLMVAYIETTEHVIHDHDPLSSDYLTEIALFGIVGPVMIAIIFTWIIRNLKLLAAAYEKIETFNTALEEKIKLRVAELEKANQELRQLDQLKSEFVSLVSHELRTPLTNIQGGLEVINTDHQSVIPPAAKETFAIVQIEVRRLIRLVLRILDVSALESGQLRLNCGPVSVRLIINQIKKDSLLFDAAHPLQLELPAKIVLVMADEERVIDILTNLFSNAIKYSPNGSPIIVRLKQCEKHLQISVKDYGMGIKPDDQQHVLNQFYRSTDNQAIKGYGLGLYFANRLIEAHGGRLWIDSKGIPGEGTEVFFTLPIDEEPGNGADSLN